MTTGPGTGRMGREYHYRLRVVGPEEIDAETWAEIGQINGVQESDEESVVRWLGSIINAVEGDLSSGLPEGWFARIEP